MNRKRAFVMILISLLIASLACSLVGGLGEEAVVEEAAPEAESDAAVEEEEAAPTEEEPVEEAEEMEEPEAEEAEEAEQVEEEQPEEEDAAPAEEESAEYDTEFPLPETVENFMGSDDTQVNFSTDLSIEEAIEFYRQAFEDAGLTERTINTAITDTTFSMVFDGHESGQAIVVQGVDLGDGSTNINIRFEDV